MERPISVHDVFTFYECLMGRPFGRDPREQMVVCALVAATERDDCDAYVQLSMN